MPEQDVRSTTAPATTTTPRAPATEPDAQDLMGNAAVAQQVASEQEPTLTGIVHVGMNKYARDEARALNRYNADKGGAKGIRDSGQADTLTRGGTTYNLDNADDRVAFVARLGLKPDLATEVVEFLARGTYNSRDELGQIIEVYVQAENGVRRMDRVVFSGHSIGEQIWGDDNGEIPFTTFAALAQLFPRAASQVKHLMLSACYTGSESNVAVFRGMFPNLESLMFYAGSSPGTWSGAMDHMKVWEKATEDGDGSDVDRDIAKGYRKDHNVATWNIKDGYQGDDPMSLWEIESELSSQDNVYQRFYRGDEAVTTAQSGPLRNYYNLLQQAIGHPDMSGGRVAELKQRRDITIRLLYWSTIAKKFSSAYSSRLSAGYTEAGRDMPDFAAISRAGAFVEATELGAVAHGSAAVDALDLVDRGLVKLDTTLVPTTWV